MPLLEGIALSAAQKGATRALSWASADTLKRWSARKTKQQLTQPSSLNKSMDVILELDPNQTEALQRFFESADFERIVFSLTSLEMLRALGEGNATQVDDIRTELKHALRLQVDIRNEVILSKLTTIAFDLIETSVSAQVAQYFDQTKRLTPQMRASITKMAANVATASARNAELLSNLASIVTYQIKEQEVKAAYRNLHSKMRLPHAGITKLVPYSQLFVQPLMQLVGGHENVPPDHTGLHDLPALLGQTHRLVLLGDPGGGKSTSSTKLTWDISAGKVKEISASIVFFIVLRDYARMYKEQKLSLVDYIILSSAAPYHVDLEHDMINYWLFNGRAVVVFDGLDELLDTSLRRDVVQIVEGFCHRFPTAPVLVTSRKVGYEEAPLDSDLFHQAHIDRFGYTQIKDYAEKWFKLDGSIAKDDRQALMDAFLFDTQFVRDLTANPLLLSLMCGLYASERYIPKNRPDVYERCALLLFEKWDKQRGIIPSLSFDAHVQSAMRSLALWLYPRSEAQTGLPRGKLIEFVKDYLLSKRFDDEDEAEKAATEFIDFCKGRAWVLTDVGSELYGFTHRTFLEYFAASQLVKTNRSAKSLFAELWPHIKRAEWEVVAQLAVQILGKSIDDGADDFLQLLVEKSATSKRSTEKYNGLAFACRALSFVVPRPAVLRLIVEAVVDHHCEQPVHKDRRRDLLGIGGFITGVTAENQRLTAKYFEAKVRERLERDPMDERALRLAWAITSYGEVSGVLEDEDEFWRTKQDEYANTFSTYIDLQAMTIPWAAGRRALQKKLPLRPLVDNFGLGALFQPNEVGGHYVFMPAIVACVHAALGEWDDEDPLDDKQLRELHDLLIEADTPWVTETPSLRHLSEISEISGVKGSNLHLSVATLVKLPLREMRAARSRAKARIRADRTKWLATAGADLERTGQTARVIHEIAEQGKRLTVDTIAPLGLLADANELIVRWCNGDINLVDRTATPDGADVTSRAV